MCRRNRRVKSSPEEVVSADENILLYCKPVRLYNILHLRNLCNRAFLPRCLDFKIRARKRKCVLVTSSFTGIVVFNYKDRNNTLQETEVTENCSCPFCHMRCGNLKGLQLHLTTIHDLFEFEFVLSEEYLTVNVSMKLDESGFEVEIPLEDKHVPYFFCSKSRKNRKRGDRKKARRPKVLILPMDSPNLANGTENGIDLNNGNRGLGYPEAIELVGKFGMTNNTPPTSADSSAKSDAKSMLPSKAVVVAATKAKKLSAERSEARSHLLLKRRQFYHSHRVQPMSIEQVMSDRDSEDEVDDDVAEFEDRQMLDDFVDVSKDEKHFMHLWNTFVRKQRVIADNHVPWACEAFSRFYKRELLNYPPFYSSWRLFMIKLWNHGIILPSTINNCNIILKSCDNNNNSNTNNNNNVEDHRDDMEVDNNS